MFRQFRWRWQPRPHLASLLCQLLLNACECCGLMSNGGEPLKRHFLLGHAFKKEEEETFSLNSTWLCEKPTSYEHPWGPARSKFRREKAKASRHFFFISWHTQHHNDRNTSLLTGIPQPPYEPEKYCLKVARNMKNSYVMLKEKYEYKCTWISIWISF